MFDRLKREPLDIQPVELLMWKRREIENYLCTRATLEAYVTATAESAAPGPIFTGIEVNQRLVAMDEAIGEVETALTTLGLGSPWSVDIKASNDFLDPLFKAYYRKLALPNLMAKKAFYELVEYIPEAEIDPEISEKLDAIARVAEQATPECGRG